MLAYATVITLQASDGSALRFDRADFDEPADRLRLSLGEDRPVAARLTPEGHLVHVGACEGDLCGIVLTRVRDRLRSDGRIEVTLGPLRWLSLDATQIAALISGSGVRTAPRFARFATAPFR